MICPKCNLPQPNSSIRCASCGLNFAQYSREQKKLENADATSEADFKSEQIANGIGSGFSAPNQLEREGTKLVVWGRFILFLLLLYETYRLFQHSVIMLPFHYDFLHVINLVFHEAGHWIFRPFGEFMTFFGGTLNQLLIPLVCLLAFWIKEHEFFSVSVMLWWLGENLLETAPYINDARDRTLILLGGNTGQEIATHDWENILIKLDALRYDHDIANFIFGLGKTVMVAALIMGAIVLVKQTLDAYSSKPD